MTSQEFAHAFSRIRAPYAARDRWHELGAAHISRTPPWAHRSGGGRGNLPGFPR
jgi:hypothetical protein